MHSSSERKWWDEDEGSVHEKVVPYVGEVERINADHFDRFVKLAFLYDPSDRSHFDTFEGPVAQVQDNVVASNVDTVHAIVAATEVRARFMTKDGNWSEQRRAMHLEWYAENLSAQLEVDEKCSDAFKDGALKGTGLIKVYIDEFKQIRAERVMVDDIIVDNAEVRDGKPRQMHQRRFVDRDELKAAYPGFEAEIDKSQMNSVAGISWRYWAGYRPIERNEIVVLESWRLPVGVKGRDGYKSGRHTICIDGADLFYEDYDETYFPFAVFRWSKRDTGWYGLSLAERIAGHQRALNKLNWQIDRQLDQMAVPTTYVRLADANLATKTTNRLGTIAVYKGDLPQTVIPKAVSPETYGREETLHRRSYEISGVSKMSATSMKPGGLDSGAAIREYRDVTTQRFAPQEKAFERLKLDVVWLMIACAKQLGNDAPIMLRRSRWGAKKIEWSDVDMGDVKFQIKAAANLSKTPAGRMQLTLEWAQAGIISQDEARSLIEHPDTEHALSLYTAADRDIERCIEESLDGNILMPEPYQNLKLGVWKYQQSYLKARNDGAPEDILEGLRQWIVQAGFILNPPVAPQPTAGDMVTPQVDPNLDPEAAMEAPAPPSLPDMGQTLMGAGVTPADLLQ